MKTAFTLAILFFTAIIGFGQQNITDLDRSPLDLSYYPQNYPILKMKGQVTGDPLARILYSRPQKKGRDIFGTEVKYGEVWRLGANEATELELFKPATLGGKRVPKGRYTVYCIPDDNKWTIIINKDNYSWGSFTYRPEKDVLRIDVPVQKAEVPVEALTMYFDASSWNIVWDMAKVQIPVSF